MKHVVEILVDLQHSGRGGPDLKDSAPPRTNRAKRQASGDYRNEFDLSNEWVGYWLHARDNVWLRFDLDNEWTAFTT